MQNENALIYIIKRGMPPHVSSLNYAVPINNDTHPQRLQCSGRTVQRIEIIFPIRITEPPTAVLNDDKGNEMTEIVFEGVFTNPSRAIFFSDVDFTMDGIELKFHLTRDCVVILYMKD